MFKRKQKELTPEQQEVIRTKDFFDCIAPATIKFFSDYYIVGNSYRCVWAIKEYPPATEEQAIFAQLADRSGVTLRIYSRPVDALEQRQILQHAERKNKLKLSGNNLQDSVEAESNLRDLTDMLANRKQNREILVHCAVFIELRARSMDALYYRLGQMNLTGSGTTENTDLARDYFEKAAKLGNVDALFGLGKLYLSKTFSGYDPRTAVEYLASAARKGHDFAQYTLGRLYLQGIEVRKNPDYAVTWLEEAVKNENTYAQYLLGRVLLMGEDVPQDRDKGADLIRKSADSGNTTAAYTMGKLLLEGMWIPQDIRTGMDYMTRAAEHHFSAAQYYLGKVFYEGKLVPKNATVAVQWLERSARCGNTYGAYLAGKILLTDESVKDPARAVQNFELAAQYGNDYAEYQLGKLYLSGKDVPQDQEKAFAYLNAAASHGNQYAAQMLKSLHENRNWNAAVGSIRLLHHMSRMLKNQAEEDRKELANVMTDRKLRRQIEEKKQAQGLKS